MHLDRFERLYRALSETGLDAVALNAGPTLTYLTGMNFHLMERPTVLLAAPGQRPLLVMPELERQKVAGSELQTFAFGDDPARWGDAFAQAAAALGLDGRRIGVEPLRMRFMELSYLQTALPNAHFVSADTALNALRLQKDAQEVESMRRAVQIAQAALLATLPMIHAGVTERAIAAELCVNLLRGGADAELPFQPIVSGGPNSANPHAVPSERPLQTGDLLVIDWGAMFDGYVADLTRTFAIGTVSDEFQHIAQYVLQANTQGRAASRPGVRAGAVDAAARAVIEEGGYGPYFTHRTGHGIGLEAHEPPYMYGANDLILQPGMAFTVEPGIYLPGRGGVRIEDNLVITAGGAETLSDLPRELITLG